MTRSIFRIPPLQWRRKNAQTLPIAKKVSSNRQISRQVCNQTFLSVMIRSTTLSDCTLWLSSQVCVRTKFQHLFRKTSTKIPSLLQVIIEKISQFLTTTRVKMEVEKTTKLLLSQAFVSKVGLARLTITLRVKCIKQSYNNNNKILAQLLEVATKL